VTKIDTGGKFKMAAAAILNSVYRKDFCCFSGLIHHIVLMLSHKLPKLVCFYIYLEISFHFVNTIGLRRGSGYYKPMFKSGVHTARASQYIQSHLVVQWYIILISSNSSSSSSSLPS